VHLFPTPDAAATVTVKGNETFTPLALDADTFDLPIEAQYAIKDMAIYYLMEYDNDPRTGQLMVTSGGALQATGGQAAKALLSMNKAKGAMGDHYSTPPKRVSVYEQSVRSQLRNIIRS
jgi:hypothetical protein